MQIMLNLRYVEVVRKYGGYGNGFLSLTKALRQICRFHKDLLDCALSHPESGPAKTSKYHCLKLMASFLSKHVILLKSCLLRWHF